MCPTPTPCRSRGTRALVLAERVRLRRAGPKTSQLQPQQQAARTRARTIKISFRCVATEINKESQHCGCVRERLFFSFSFLHVRRRKKFHTIFSPLSFGACVLCLRRKKGGKKLSTSYFSNTRDGTSESKRESEKKTILVAGVCES
jgi:hypothetical protein